MDTLQNIELVVVCIKNELRLTCQQSWQPYFEAWALIESEACIIVENLCATTHVCRPKSALSKHSKLLVVLCTRAVIRTDR